jgi:chromate reductase
MEIEMAFKSMILFGSLRQKSFSRMVAKCLIAVAPNSVNFEILEIGQLPEYNQDFDEAPPKEWTDFRKRLKEFDAVIFVAPEYKLSVSTVLKNAFDGKPGAVISVSIGALGGFGANHHLRQSLVFLNIPTMAQPEAYIGNAAKLFEANGNLNDESTRKFLTEFMSAFVNWVNINKSISNYRDKKVNNVVGELYV